MIAFVRCRCTIFHAQSLKDKRSVLKSTLTRMKQRFNISVAELDLHDVWQRTEIGIAAVGVTRKQADKELQKALDMLEQNDRLEVTDTVFEWL